VVDCGCKSAIMDEILQMQNYHKGCKIATKDEILWM
jgi:hypothetical protein